MLHLTHLLCQLLIFLLQFLICIIMNTAKTWKIYYMIYHPSPFYGRTPSFSLWITFLFDKWLEFSVWIFSPQIGTICHFPPLHLGTTYFGTRINGWMCSETQKCKIIVWLLIIHRFIHPDKGVSQGGRSCAKARRAFAEKFGLGQKFEALTYVILSRY